MPAGTVKQFFADKGFGFITPKDGGEDVFVHRKVQGDDRSAYLEEGQEVEYEVEWSDKNQKYAASSCTGFKTVGGGKGGKDKGKGDKGKGKDNYKGKDSKGGFKGKGDDKGKSKGDDRPPRAPRYEDTNTDSSTWGVRDISKKLSWILRNGAAHLGVNMDKDGWVRVDNLLGSEALPKLTTEKLIEVIEDSNKQKPRYEIRNSGSSAMMVRAAGEKTAANRGDRDGERRHRDDRGDRDRRRDRDSDRDKGKEPPTSPSLSQALQNLPPPAPSGSPPPVNSTLNASAGEWKPGQAQQTQQAQAAYMMQMQQMQQAMAYAAMQQMMPQQQQQQLQQMKAWQAMQAAQAAALNPAQQGKGGKGGKGAKAGGRGKGSGRGGRGTVKQFFPDKGFGFITPKDGGEDVFVHRKVQGGDRTAYLEEGQEVEYEVEWNDKNQKYAASKCTGFKTGGGEAKAEGTGGGEAKAEGTGGGEAKAEGAGAGEAQAEGGAPESEVPAATPPAAEVPAPTVPSAETPAPVPPTAEVPAPVPPTAEAKAD